MAGLLNRGAAGGRRRRWAALAVVAAVLGVHGCLGSEVAELMVDAGSASKPAMQRMDVAFVRELQQAAPAPVAPRVAPPPAPRAVPVERAAAPDPAASAAEAADAQAQAEAKARAEAVRAEWAALAAAEAASAAAAQAAQEALAAAPAASAPAAAASALAQAAATAASAPPAPSPAVAAASMPPTSASAPAAALSVASAVAPHFDWPPSTRLDYTLTGNYRGEVNGSARVQWIRQGQRYQVQVDVRVGPSVAPLVARRMTSDGSIGASGLVPRRYEEETSTLFGQPRRRGLSFEPDRIVLDRGTAEPWPGVQDTASQFVQLTWLFTTQPQLLKVGQALEFPLALPRRIDRWHYDVVAEETLHTRVGELRTFHVKPRRESTRPGELTAELWFAPTLQYLPVRILIRHEGDTYVDLMLNAPPLQTP
ncbi:DUF3108 domain-containing protein [uncultured Aquincola sp.]|uniref:DUF3108 domain-containing protein n=1 Tax=uncultured Aquincola sp. TaxID=886556 RepID=UPI0032B2EE10